VRVFLDTNVLASSLATRGLCAELFEVVLQSHELITSEAVLTELARVLPGKLRLSTQITREYLSLIEAYAEIAAANKPWPELPDRDDEPIIAAAVAGKADVFVTGDKDLAELQRIGDLPILSHRQFWELLAGETE